jgi:hypothetical protein
MNPLSTVLPATVISLKSQDEVFSLKSCFINPTDCFVISPLSHSQPSSFVNLNQLKKTMKSPSFVSENHMFPWFLGGPTFRFRFQGASAIILSAFRHGRHGADGALAMAVIIALTATEDDFDADFAVRMARAAWELRGPGQGQPLMVTI